MQVRGTTRDLIQYAVSGQLPSSKDSSSKDKVEVENGPLISKSAILRLLSEFVRSYPGCAQVIAEHKFLIGQTEIVLEVKMI